MDTYEKKYKDANNKVAARFGTNVAKEIFTDLYESEDERMMHQLHSWMKEFGGAEEYTEKVYTWLKSLLEKQGEQKPWSEEDMSKVQRICKYLDEAKKYYADITEVRECINWLKELKDRVQPQNTWKPSEEQMKALDNALSIAKNCGEESAFDLRTLYEQLKKLKGE